MYVPRILLEPFNESMYVFVENRYKETVAYSHGWILRPFVSKQPVVRVSF